jgi:hypothetical protein
MVVSCESICLLFYCYTFTFCLHRIHRDILLHYNKAVLFGTMAERESRDRADLKIQLTKVSKIEIYCYLAMSLS